MTPSTPSPSPSPSPPPASSPRGREDRWRGGRGSDSEETPRSLQGAFDGGRARRGGDRPEPSSARREGYSKWSEYHTYLHSYEIEREYVEYCQELSKQLKWMEPYVDMDRSSVKWGKISPRGTLQAIKIAATSFHKITSCLAFTGYYEYKESIAYDNFWFKEYDGVYFEIWRRVTRGMKSFRDALEEVYNLDRFPLRQHLMKAALEYDEAMKMVEDEFLTCTAAITPEVKDNKAKDLIAEAVNQRVQKPKSYEEYIINKIHIARIIGILDSEE